jgi:hypothetical protein
MAPWHAEYFKLKEIRKTSAPRPFFFLTSSQGQITETRTPLLQRKHEILKRLLFPFSTIIPEESCPIPGRRKATQRGQEESEQTGLVGPLLCHLLLEPTFLSNHISTGLSIHKNTKHTVVPGALGLYF